MQHQDSSIQHTPQYTTTPSLQTFSLARLESFCVPSAVASCVPVTASTSTRCVEVSTNSRLTGHMHFAMSSSGVIVRCLGADWGCAGGGCVAVMGIASGASGAVIMAVVSCVSRRCVYQDIVNVECTVLYAVSGLSAAWCRNTATTKTAMFSLLCYLNDKYRF